MQEQEISGGVQPPSSLTPRSLRERDAANYLGFCCSYLRNLRVADMRRKRAGEPIEGPRWAVFGVAVRYLKEDLDAWIDVHRDPEAKA